MRDYALVAREANNVFDVWDVDGPVASIRDRLIYGMTNVKKSSMLLSQEFRNLRTVEGEEAANKLLRERLTNAQRETEEGIDMLIEAIQKSESGSLADATLEYVSMANKRQNWEDVDQWMKSRLLGREYVVNRMPA